MCGLFGGIQVSRSSVEAFTATVRALGHASQERGRDSAGIALVKAQPTGEGALLPQAAHSRLSHADLNDVVILKDKGLFDDLPWETLDEIWAITTVAIGHTRAATQGAIGDLANASPLLAGALLGTHNGDIDVASVPRGRRLREHSVGQTDTEVLYRALNAVRKDRREVTNVLRSVKGRAALAYFDRSRPDRLFLARTALSPLCYAYDQHGNFYYASNPDWFRRVQVAIPTVRFSDITLIPEGHLLTVSIANGSVTDTRRFTPTCRERDLGLLNSAVYRGFTDADKAVDQSLHRHRVAHSLGAWPKPIALSSVPASTPSSQPLQNLAGDVTTLWDDDLDSLPSIGNGVDIDEAERLCWNGSEFDFVTFETLLSLESDEANALMNTLRRQA